MKIILCGKGGCGVDKNADIILMVIDPSYESIRLSEKVHDMSRKLGKPVFFIINKAGKGADSSRRQPGWRKFSRGSFLFLKAAQVIPRVKETAGW